MTEKGGGSCISYRQMTTGNKAFTEYSSWGYMTIVYHIYRNLLFLWMIITVIEVNFRLITITLTTYM